MKRLTDIAERALGWITGLTLFVMMWLTFVDVTGRDLFGAPVPGGFEITQLLMAVLVFTALPIVTGRETHVSISLVEQVLKGTAKKIQCVVVSLIGAVGVGYMGLMLWKEGERLAVYGDYTAYLHMVLWPFAYLMAVFSCLSSVILFWLVVRYLMTPADEITGGSAGGEF
jgi:TRAP-type C4-dicarboxylate transport system permease small subunit